MNLYAASASKAVVVPGPWTGAQRVLALLLLGLLYYGAGRLGLSMAVVHPHASAVWPASGVAIGTLLLGGLQAWPVVLVASFAVNLTISGHPWTALGIGAGNTLEALLGAYLAARFAGGRRAFEESRRFFLFAVLLVAVAPLPSATLGVGSLVLGGLASASDYWRIAGTWWLGNALGALLACPLLVLWCGWAARPWNPRRMPEWLALLATQGLVCWLVFGHESGFGPYLTLPVVLWAAFRFGPREAATATFVTAAIALAGTLRRTGPFDPDQNSSLLLMQSFLGVLALTGLSVGTLVEEQRRGKEALEAAKGELETRVAQRTEELSSSVQSLDEEIAARRRTEAERRASEARFRGLVEWAPDALVIVEPRGRIVLMNAQAERLFGYGREELVGSDFEVLVPGRFRAFHRQRLEACAGDSEVRRNRASGMSLYGLRKDGSEFPVEITLGPLETEEGTLISSAIRDTTERKRFEEEVNRLNADLEHMVEERTRELRRSNEELEQFAYVASHDLQEPLRMVSTFVRLLEKRYASLLDDDGREFVQFAVDGAERMHRLINDLLVYSRLERAPTFTRVESSAVLASALENLRASMGENAAVVTTGDLPAVRADATQLEQLFQNLVGNALKFQEKGAQPRIHVEAQGSPDGWRFSVRDNGIGIDAAFGERIFALFQRLHALGEYEGTGIGLAICKKIVDRHGGQIWVESSPGAGSTFHFTLPGAEEQEA